jgi:hypothetical protein
MKDSSIEIIKDSAMASISPRCHRSTHILAICTAKYGFARFQQIVDKKIPAKKLTKTLQWHP